LAWIGEALLFQTWAVVVSSSQFLKVLSLAKLIGKMLMGVNELEQVIDCFLTGYLLTEIASFAVVFGPKPL
jgi:hypothetical protein